MYSSTPLPHNSTPCSTTHPRSAYHAQQALLTRSTPAPITPPRPPLRVRVDCRLRDEEPWPAARLRELPFVAILSLSSDKEDPEDCCGPSLSSAPPSRWSCSVVLSLDTGWESGRDQPLTPGTVCRFFFCVALVRFEGRTRVGMDGVEGWEGRGGEGEGVQGITSQGQQTVAPANSESSFQFTLKHPVD